MAVDKESYGNCRVKTLVEEGGGPREKATCSAARCFGNRLLSPKQRVLEAELEAQRRLSQRRWLSMALELPGDES